MLIVDMPMPLRCPCELAEDNNGWYAPCFAYYGEPEREKEFDRCVEHGTRPDWCPIVGVLPEEHGRLGDLDELAAGCDDPYWCRWLSEIEDAPTIIPAERKDDELSC